MVFICIDTLRADRLGCYGHDRETSKHIDRFAEEGVLFENAYSPSNWTLPAMMSLWTGLRPSVHGVNKLAHRLDEHVPTLPEQFQQRGYY
ncbi:MAG: sulfatase-like hydrolase/transferase, partial [Planctomycetota bacterium]